MYLVSGCCLPCNFLFVVHYQRFNRNGLGLCDLLTASLNKLEAFSVLVLHHQPVCRWIWIGFNLKKKIPCYIAACKYFVYLHFFLWPTHQIWSRSLHFLTFLNHVHTHIHTCTYIHTHTPDRDPWKEGSACRGGRYLHDTQQTQETNIRALSGIWTHNSSSPATADLRLRPRGHRRRRVVLNTLWNHNLRMNETVIIIIIVIEGNDKGRDGCDKKTRKKT